VPGDIIISISRTIAYDPRMGSDGHRSAQPATSGLRTRQLLLAMIRDTAPITRSDLTRLSGLSRSAVAAAVQRLLDDGLVTESTAVPSGRGRPATLLRPRAPDGVLVGIDFGHDHVALAVADAHGRVLAEGREQVDVDTRSSDALDTAVRLFDEQLRSAGVDRGSVRAVVAAIPGPLDARSGQVQSATILSSWVGMAPAELLAERLQVPVHLGNDAELGALGELSFGAGRGIADLLYVKASHGIGAGLVLGGRLYQGATGIAGEIGHTQIDSAGDQCRCGQRGCLEAMVSTSVVRKQLQVSGFTVAESAWGLAEVARDPVGARVLTEAGRHLGRVVADICNCLNPGRVVLGGQLGAAGEPFATGVRESVSRYAQPAISAAADIRPAELGPRAELMGTLARGMQIAAGWTGDP
jgi:predicted NBD/HSP70 family sugar kinase